MSIKGKMMDVATDYARENPEKAMKLYNKVEDVYNGISFLKSTGAMVEIRYDIEHCDECNVNRFETVVCDGHMEEIKESI